MDEATAEFLRHNNLAAYLAAFEEAGISALELRLLDKETAKELIPKLGDRLRFLNALEGFQNPDGLINNLMCLDDWSTGKRAAYATTSRRNVEKTLAIKHQLQFSCMLFSKTLFVEELQHGPTFPELLVNLEYPGIEEEFHTRNLSPSFLVTSWIQFTGTEYKPSMILLQNFSDGNPIFFQIVKVLLFQNDSVYFICSDIETISYQRHYSAYHVKEGAAFKIISLKNLPYHLPLTLSQVANGDHYIALNYKI